jgi:hypothetical protein
VNGRDIITCSERDSDIFGIEVATGVENTFINSSVQMMAASQNKENTYYPPHHPQFRTMP